MRKLILFFIAVCFVTLTAVSQVPSKIGTPVSSRAMSYTDDNIFIYIGINGPTIHLVWDEVTTKPILYYIVEQSTDGIKFEPIASLEPSQRYDIFVNNYPKHVEYNNHILYSSETGNGRYIYNDLLTSKEMRMTSLWYRVRMITDKGASIYTKKMEEVINTGGSHWSGSRLNGHSPSQLGITPATPAELFHGNSLSGNLSNTQSTIPNGRGGPLGNGTVAQLIVCPDVQAPPAGYVYTGNFQTFFGTCCTWEEREYQLQNITAPCGAATAWCCAFDCSPLAYDPCCVHTCGEYNQCSCHPWTCCNVNNATIWIVYSSTPYTIGARVDSVQDASCNGLFDGSVAVSYNQGLPLPILYNWDNGTRTGSILQQLAAGIYSLTVGDLNGCNENLNFNIGEPAALTSTFSKRDVTCSGFGDGSIDLSVTGGVTPYSYNWTEGNTPFDTVQDLSNLGPGNYAVTVTDANGCVSNQFIPVISPDEFTGVVTMLDLGCPIAGTAVLQLCCYGSNTGSAVLSLTGGTPPSTIIWSDGSSANTFDNLSAGTYSVTAIDANGCSFSTDFTLGQPDEIFLTSTVTNTACGQCNGSATINVTGGSGGFSYLWPTTAGSQTTQTATGLCAGSYTVIVTDNFAVNCFKSITVSVSNIGAEPINTTQTNVSCFGACDGSASVNYNCVDTPCTVAWFDPQGALFSQGRNTINNVCAGSYSVVVTNGSGCIAAQTVDILEPANFVANLSVVNETCPGSCDGIASVAPTGGVSPYNYQWLDGNGAPLAQTGSLVTGLCAGNYTVVISDSSRCSSSFPFTVVSFNGLLATTVTTDNLCFGECNGSIVVTPLGGIAPYSFQWFSTGNPIPGATGISISGLCMGTYSVLVTDKNGCSYTTPDIFINEPVELTATVSSTDLLCTSICNGTATATAAGGTGTLSYKWFNSFAVEIPGETVSSIANLCAGDYFVQVSDSNGCSTELLPFTINDINPLTATLTASNVSCNGAGDGSIDLEVSGGFPPYTFSWNGGLFTTQDLSGIPAGDYTVVITDSSGCSITDSATVVEPDILSAPITIKTYGQGGYHVSCQGNSDGNLTVNPTGGTPPFTYIWSNGQFASSAVGLGLGTYSVTVLDANGCSAVNSETLSLEPGPFTSEVTAFVYSTGFNVSCFGLSDGSIDLTVTGGEPPFIFNWTRDSINDAYLVEDPTNVPAGTYYANVVDTSLGCITRDTIVLTQPTEIVPVLTPSIYPGGVNVSTQGGSDGSIDLEVSGGAAPYTYQWDNANADTTQDISGLTAGTYTCTITDANGCSVAASITLRDPQPSLEVIDTTVCQGDSVYAGGAFQYTSGTYTDSFLNMFGLDSVIVTNLTVLSNSQTILDVQICQGLSYFAGGGLQTTSGTYFDKYSAANGCDSIVTTNLSVVLNPPTTVDVSICYGQSYFVGGDFQTTSGTYYDTLTAADGCDSLIATNLTVSNLPITADVQICQGQSYFAGGAFQTTSGTYYDTASASNSCDSITITNLSVILNPPVDVNVQICDGSGYFAGGALQTTSGTYYDTLTASNGCDSVVVTHLTVSTSLDISFNTIGVGCRCSANAQPTICPLDLSGLAQGSILTNQLTAQGVTVTGVSNSANYPNAVGVFDSNLPNPANADLSVGIGNILLLPKNLTDNNHDGLIDNITDSPAGGTMTFSFDRDRTVVSLVLIDNDRMGTVIKAYDANNNLLLTMPVPPPSLPAGAVHYEVSTLNISGVRKLTVSYGFHLAVGGLLLDCPAVSCGLDYSALVHKTVLANELASQGVTVTGVSSNPANYPNVVAVYNSNLSNTNSDLQVHIGNILLLPASIADNNHDGLIDWLSDSPVGGTMTFTFDQDREVLSVALIDNDRNGTVIKAYDAANNLLLTLPVPPPSLPAGAVHYETIPINLLGVRTLTISYSFHLGVGPVLLGCPPCCDGSTEAIVSGGTAPFTYAWDNGSTSSSLDSLCTGTYSVTVTDANGCSATSSVELQQCSCDNEIYGFTLVHDHFGGDVRPLFDGAVIDLDELCPLNIRAEVCPTEVGSVQFTLNGAKVRTEVDVPYALAGDNPTNDYHSWAPDTGSYTLTAVAFSGTNATGDAGAPYTIHFTVIGTPCNVASKLSSNGVEILEQPHSSEEATLDAYPNPFKDQVNILFSMPTDERVRIEIVGIDGKLVAVPFEGDINGGEMNKVEFKSGAIANGMYFYRLISDSGEIQNKKLLLFR